MANLRVSLLLAFLSCGVISPSAPTDDWNQPFRPQYHFSPQSQWTNDPNGLVYFEGEYHLFFQYNPFGDEWGHMSWGHAVSNDLLHWHELPVALPEEHGVMIFTGSTVVDENNSSGFCTQGKACLVAIYTGHTPETKSQAALQTQNLAYSNDRGRTWRKYGGNPVLDLHMSDFRDPKVFWSTERKHWVMVASLPNEHKVKIYGSPDLKKWTALSEFGPAGATGGQWECPELFRLPVEGKAGEARWVMKVGVNPGARLGGSGEQYFVGRFDGKRFVNDNQATQTMWTDYGKDCYCALTFNGLPREHKPVMIGWMDNWQYAAKLPTSPWRGQMTIPRELSLRETPEGIRLVQQPIEELRALADGKTGELKTHSFRFADALPLDKGDEVGWRILMGDGKYTAIGYSIRRKVLFVDRTHSGLVGFSSDFSARLEAPLVLSGKELELKVLVDRCSIEVFADSGRVTSTNLVFPPADAMSIKAFGGAPEIRAEQIRSIH
ncbi:MAG TPA: glycoside hydrolase family 32 protein [Bryobacteraceae bacterium]|jgi:sucrose-6-phosphate hydrolase SacC (GH32 family)|nr:glycoside hydrolase family 32 protein [Bryobacteraceae bacterium]